ncbi:acylglycerol kinase, mitochondrial [Toxorhynchites rutilus septentrionalis]|uniref:acylglycerol kinase, mitochondrial n=1 Tax=Toxorhynchites rutilus septentrionalis TaxID=329112 RepID=UPI00247958B6|nr:acylglycerol kinase, mitochondrial [Toxorhynchites rutilus septentrionalis]XP_055628930.1 acylglycerol kinase, mitochondrial [Toxorhynchites rutilus septentrionalis]
MAFIIRFAKGVRKHWKKSTFLASAVAYGVSYSSEKYEIKQLMRHYCEEASKYGDIRVPVSQRLQKVLVILNPAANRRSCEEDFHDYCEPILHLAGFEIDIVKTDSEGHARRYVEELASLPDAIVVAGGDGTISEAISGLKRRSDGAQCPIGVLPVGRTNSLATALFKTSDQTTTLENVRAMANAAYAVVAGKREKMDVMKIEVLPNEADEKVPEKPVYAIGSLQWGAFRDILALRDKYWYTGSLRDYTAFLFNAFDGGHTWNCKAKVSFTEPCSGCSNCYKDIQQQTQRKEQPRRWWSVFLPQRKKDDGIDYTKVVNNECSIAHELEINPSELVLQTANIDSEKNGNKPKLCLRIGSPVDSGFTFLGESWPRLWHRRYIECPTEKALEIRTLEIIPQNLKVTESETEMFYSIDSEAYEVRPVRITVIPNTVEIFTF